MGQARQPGRVRYRVEFHASAAAQIPGLPAEAFQALVDELLIIGADPHHRGLPHPDGPDGRLREQVFSGLGLVSYAIDETAKVVRVYAIT